MAASPAGDGDVSDRNGPPGTRNMRKKVSIDTMTSVTNANATRFAIYFAILPTPLKK